MVSRRTPGICCASSTKSDHVFTSRGKGAKLRNASSIFLRQPISGWLLRDLPRGFEHRKGLLGKAFL
jgi:hypothetical protein